jgi:hypothetical protein
LQNRSQRLSRPKLVIHYKDSWLLRHIPLLTVCSSEDAMIPFSLQFSLLNRTIGERRDFFTFASLLIQQGEPLA